MLLAYGILIYQVVDNQLQNSALGFGVYQSGVCTTYMFLKVASRAVYVRFSACLNAPPLCHEVVLNLRSSAYSVLIWHPWAVTDGLAPQPQNSSVLGRTAELLESAEEELDCNFAGALRNLSFE